MDGALVVADPLEAVVGGAINGLTAPLWVPWPVPLGWTFAGLGHVRVADADGASTVSSWIGQDPFGDPVEVFFVCEEAGTGLGSYFAGLLTNYPPASVGEGAPHAKFEVEGRSVPLWSVEAEPDRAAYAGEAAGRWLWVVAHPAEASAIVVEPLMLVDARGLGAELAVLPLGELSARLTFS